MRKLLVAVFVLVALAVGVFVSAGYMPPPMIEIVSPARFVGLATPLEIVIDAPGGRLSAVEIAFEQGGTRTPILAWTETTGSTLVEEADVAADGPDRLRITRVVGRETVPELKSGEGRIIVTAARPVLNGVRTLASEITQDVQVRLERPRLSVQSTHHYINLGGSEMVVYRVTPEDVVSGVSVGDLEYPGYPASGLQVAGVSVTDPAVRVAFFALLHDQALDAPIRLFARDEAGNSANADLDHRTFPKVFRNSRITVDDAFMSRVVSAILEGTTEVAPTGELIDQYVAINSELRRLNAEKIASFASQTANELLWQGVVFHPFTNNAVESGFADRRSYFYEGREVDRQVHLGFDLASYAQTPIVSANRGRVLFAEELGIYGNCVIVDHGMGLQSLYAHLSTIEVQVGDQVEKAQPLGRSGMTGLAGGDHLHFTMLVQGRMVNPVEWWDAHWIQDRILRKIQ